MRRGKTFFYCSVVLVLALCVLAPVSVLAQTAGLQIFVLVDGIKGESTDANHKDWIDAFSYGDGVTNGLNPGYSNPGASGYVTRADFAPISIVKQIDIASPKLREAVAMSRHFKKVTIEFWEQGSKIFVVVLEGDVIISLVQSVMPDLTSVPMATAAAISVLQLQEKVSFSYGKISWTYYGPHGVVSGGYDLQRQRGGV